MFMRVFLFDFYIRFLFIIKVIKYIDKMRNLFTSTRSALFVQKRLFATIKDLACQIKPTDTLVI